MKSRVLLLALLSIPLGCKKEQPSAPTPPGPAAPAPAKKDPLTEVPQTDSTLSLLEPQGGKCVWSRQNPVDQKRATVASLDGDCQGARIAWSQDQQKALIWFDPELVQMAGYSSQTASPAGYKDEEPKPDAKPRLYEVKLSSGEVRAIAFPTLEGELRELGYKGQDVVALSIKQLLPEQAEGPVTVDGQSISIPAEGEGLPALAYAYRLEPDGKFKRVEVKGTHEGAGMSEGISVLGAASGWGPRSTELLNSQLSNEGPELTEEQLAKLAPFVPAPLAQTVKESGLPDDVSWAQVVTPAGPLYVWQVMGDTVHTTGHLLFGKEGQLSPLKELGFTDGDVVSVATRGPFVLVSAERVGTHPRMYDLRTGKLVFRSDTARATTFWPAH